MADLDVLEDDCDSELNVGLVDQKSLPKRNGLRKVPLNNDSDS